MFIFQIVCISLALILFWNPIVFRKWVIFGGLFEIDVHVLITSLYVLVSFSSSREFNHVLLVISDCKWKFANISSIFWFHVHLDRVWKPHFIVLMFWYLFILPRMFVSIWMTLKVILTENYWFVGCVYFCFFFLCGIWIIIITW